MIKIFIFDQSALVSELGAKDAFGFGAAEVERLLAIKNDSRRAESASALAALARLMDVAFDGARPTIKRLPGGKPCFDSSPLSLSLAHSHGISAAAVCDGGEVGIDLELIREHRDRDALAKRFFSVSELDELEKSEDKTAEFFRIWTEKEAFSKMTGKGLASVIKSEEIYPSSKIFSFVFYNNDVAHSLSICTILKNTNVEFYNNLSNAKLIKRNKK